MASRQADGRWERRLGIVTGAGDYEKEDANHSRYEPTSYAVLERLAESGQIGRDDVVLDYGCGKGRTGFYLNYALGCRTVGVEYNAALVTQAQENLASYVGRKAAEGRIRFAYANAEDYAVGDANCFYFFNPFSLKILQTAVQRIFEAYYSDPKTMKLFFYYATDEYLRWLMGEERLEFAGEIDCRDLFHNDDPKEKIWMFRIEGM